MDALWAIKDGLKSGEVHWKDVPERLQSVDDQTKGMSKQMREAVGRHNDGVIKVATDAYIAACYGYIDRRKD